MNKVLLNVLRYALVSVSIFVMTAIPANAQPWGGNRPGMGHGGYSRDITAVPDLNLTAEQSAKLLSLREAFLKDIKPVRDKIFSKRGDLKLLWLEKNPNQAKILAVQKEIRNLRGQIQERATKYRLSAMKVLTAEQQDKVKKFRQGFRQEVAGKKRDFAGYLKLSDEQKVKMKELRSRYWADTRDLRYDIAMKRLEMRKLFTDPKTDGGMLLAKQKEITALRQTLSEKKFQMKLEIRSMLSPEQLVKLDQMKARKHGMRRGCMMGHRG